MFWEEIGLFLAFVCCAYATIKHNSGHVSISKTLATSVAIVIILPIYEESLFRHTLVVYTKHLWYYEYLNVVLFGLWHVPNVVVFGLSKTLIQLPAVLYLGYYIIQLDNVPLAMILHILFNFCVMCALLVHVKMRPWVGSLSWFGFLGVNKSKNEPKGHIYIRKRSSSLDSRSDEYVKILLASVPKYLRDDIPMRNEKVKRD